ncbi:uncharacterized protein K460DRAFT_407256 [Cucurbitaria berberidis CBS 394.84]|uniref:Uncharacterized protein n=1 Tax=Cucurbitaria berberidis CBS 394.84 TaxID=1168544 RepID=A0A9P4GCV8_9PLEO|nr:uncharacterized protein K460DRAFT_407256 [Cucurbitaria berberidis CBS 394.84]KAF1842875.1 hypothetical protein K460DRAFT_407256 [Cucurbitaria berberidis CBS 394.84]
MPPGTSSPRPQLGIWTIKYRAFKQTSRIWVNKRGHTTCEWYYGLMTDLGYTGAGLLEKFDDDDAFYAEKKELVMARPLEHRLMLAEHGINELATWWYDPKTHTVDRFGEKPGSVIQLGLFIHLLRTLTTKTHTFLQEGRFMTLKEAEEHERRLNKTLQDDPELKELKLTAEMINDLLKEEISEPEASAEAVNLPDPSGAE